MNNFVVHQHFIFREFNCSQMFSKQFCFVVTLQVLHIVFNIAIEFEIKYCGYIYQLLLQKSTLKSGKITLMRITVTYPFLLKEEKSGNVSASDFDNEENKYI